MCPWLIKGEINTYLLLCKLFFNMVACSLFLWHYPNMVRKGSGILVVNTDGSDFSLTAAFPLHADVQLPQDADLQDAVTFNAYLASLMAESARLGIQVDVPVTAIYSGQDPALMARWSPEHNDGDGVGGPEQVAA